jgi:polar amino acid transport system substrate-binding protein
MRITLGKEVAKRFCLKPEYIRIEFSAMIPGLQAGRWDMINTGIFWNPKRAAMMNMIPYESAAISISVKKGNPLGISKQEDLAGKAVGVEIGGLEEKKLNLEEKKLKEIDKNLRAKGLTPINIRVFDNFALAYQALRAGQTDASVAIDATAAEYAKRGEFDRAISGMFPINIDEIPDDLLDKSKQLREQLLETAAEASEELMDEYGLLPNSSPFIIRGP